MCWSTNLQLEKRTASKDIKVFKVGNIVDGQLMSYYQGFYYDFNQPYRTDVIPTSYYGSYFIYQGFHSYNPKKCKYIKADTTGWWIVKSGRIDLDTYDSTTNIIECIVPKGAEYYQNEHGEIVSNQIIINKIMNKLCVG